MTQKWVCGSYGDRDPDRGFVGHLYVCIAFAWEFGA